MWRSGTDVTQDEIPKVDCATFFGSSQLRQEGQEGIVSPKSPAPFRFWRTQRSQRLLLHGKISLDVFVRCLDTLVTEPEGDHRNINTRLEQRHRCSVTEAVR